MVGNGESVRADLVASRWLRHIRTTQGERTSLMLGSKIKQRSKAVYRDAGEGHRSATSERRDGQPRQPTGKESKAVYMGATPHTPFVKNHQEPAAEKESRPPGGGVLSFLTHARSPGGAACFSEWRIRTGIHSGMM
jgi:hypothetical protein